MYKYMTIELESDVLGSRWVLENIAKNKVAGVGEISAELFKILPDDSVEEVQYIFCKPVQKT